MPAVAREKMSEVSQERVLEALDYLAEALALTRKAKALLDDVRETFENQDTRYRWHHDVSCVAAHARNALYAAGECATQIHLESVTWETWEDRLQRHGGENDCGQVASEC